VIVDPKKLGLNSRLKIDKKEDSISIIIDRKSRIIMKDGIKIHNNVKIIKKHFDLPVQLITNAPVCSKTSKYLNSVGVYHKPLK